LLSTAKPETVELGFGPDGVVTALGYNVIGDARFIVYFFVMPLL